MVCKTWPSFNPHTNLVAVISVPANYLGQRLLRIFIIYLMKFHNSNHVSSPLKGMIHKHNNIQGNKMIKHSIHEQSFYDNLSYYWLLDYYKLTISHLS